MNTTEHTPSNIPASTLLLIFCAMHLVIWLLVPAIFNQNLPLDVIEELTWGREWQLGYDKHPPMSAWLKEITAFLTFRSDWGQYLLSQLCITTAFFMMWKLARNFVGPVESLVSVLLLETIYFHNFTSPEFNVNISLLLFWALSITAFWKALTEKQLRYWIMAGAFASGMFYSKYLSAYLIASLFLYLLFSTHGRESLKSKGLYIGIAVFLLLITPHIIWMFHNDFITIQYGLNRASSETPDFIGRHVINPLKYLVAFLLALIPLLLLARSLGKLTLQDRSADSDGAKFILFISFVPLLLTLATALFFGFRLRTMWSTPYFLSFGLLVVYFLRPHIELHRLKRFGVYFALIAMTYPILYATIQHLAPSIKHDGKRTHFPGDTLAMQVTETWNSKFDKPLRFVIGDPWTAGNIAWYAQERPSVYLNGDHWRSPWVSDRDIRRNGAVITWDKGTEDNQHSLISNSKLAEWKSRFGTVEMQPPLLLAWKTEFEIPGKVVGWAIIPPEKTVHD
ncbi:MAG: glycosyltransferase family 39 protein [Candidatus Sedimenticola sp. 4PFRAG1]